MAERQVLVESSDQAAIEVAAELIAGIACEAVARHGQCSIALAGGTTPYRLYECLASAAESEKIPWPQVLVFFGDERDVPPDHADSNYRMAQDTLLGAVPIRWENVFPMAADSADLNLAARQYAETVIQRVPAGPDGVPAFDLVLLGMGGDGHTASLFPGTPAIQEREKLVVAQHVPVLGRDRMTFTLPLLNAARHVMFLVTGLDKAEAVGAILGDDGEAARRLPAGLVAPTHGKLYFVLDADAASRTRYRTQSKGVSL